MNVRWGGRFERRIAELERERDDAVRSREVHRQTAELLLDQLSQTRDPKSGINGVVIASIGAIVAAALSAGAVYLSTDKRDCATVVQDYTDQVRGNPARAKILTDPTVDNAGNRKSTVASDPAAIRCNITNLKVIQLSR